MEANNILTAHLLDIIFEGKNKDYGAYELRNTYNKRISIALLITIAIIVILFIAATITNPEASKDVKQRAGRDIIIQNISPPQPQLPPPPVLPPLPPPVATIAYPPPLIVKDNDVGKPPLDIEQLANARIDLKTAGGTRNDDYINPPLDVKGTQVVAIPVERQIEDFIPIEKEASFPGGSEAWSKYIQKAIEKDIDEFTETDYGTCVVKFVVDKSGKVSQVEATTMKGSKLAEIAINAIGKGPNWIPAQQNGNYVNTYRFQPVSLKNPGQ